MKDILDVKEFIKKLKLENGKSFDKFRDGKITRQEMLEELSFRNIDKLAGKDLI